MLLQGSILSQAWTNDNNRVCGVGMGKELIAKVVVHDTGSKVGDLTGPTKTILAVDIKPKPFRLIMGGENQSIFVFDGVPFKAVKTISGMHTNFINGLKFSPNGN